MNIYNWYSHKLVHLPEEDEEDWLLDDALWCGDFDVTLRVAGRVGRVVREVPTLFCVWSSSCILCMRQGESLIRQVGIDI